MTDPRIRPPSLSASSAESKNGFRLGEAAQVVESSEFYDGECADAVALAGHQFHPVVEALHGDWGLRNRVASF